MLQPPNYRSIVYSEEVETFVDASAREYSRFQELWEALEHLLSRSPQVGLKMPIESETDWRVVQTAAWPHQGVPVVELAYWYTDTEVYFEFARIKE